MYTNSYTRRLLRSGEPRFQRGRAPERADGYPTSTGVPSRTAPGPPPPRAHYDLRRGAARARPARGRRARRTDRHRWPARARPARVPRRAPRPLGPVGRARRGALGVRGEPRDRRIAERPALPAAGCDRPGPDRARRRRVPARGRPGAGRLGPRRATRRGGERAAAGRRARALRAGAPSSSAPSPTPTSATPTGRSRSSAAWRRSACGRATVGCRRCSTSVADEEALPALERAVVDHPLRERPVAMLMLARYRERPAGRRPRRVPRADRPPRRARPRARRRAAAAGAAHPATGARAARRRAGASGRHCRAVCAATAGAAHELRRTRRRRHDRGRHSSAGTGS